MCRVIVGDEHEIVGARLWLARLRVGREHGVEERRQHRCGVRGNHDDTSGPADQPARRVREQQVEKDRDEERAEERAERVRQGVVRFVEARHEDAEADRDHQHPRAIARPARPADQPRRDEREAHEEHEGGRQARVVVVVAREGQSYRDGPGDYRSRPEEEPWPPRQAHAAKNAAIAAPDRSAFGTKPWAPQSPIQRP